MTREQYESLALSDLKGIAKARGMRGTSTLKKAALIDAMLEQDRIDEEAKAAPAPAPTPVATAPAAAAAEYWTLQLGAFGTKTNADLLVTNLKKQKITCTIIEQPRGERTLYLVQTAPYNLH